MKDKIEIENIIEYVLCILMVIFLSAIVVLGIWILVDIVIRPDNFSSCGKQHIYKG
jgi:hypothetical protein